MVNNIRLLKLPCESSFFLFGPRQVGKSTLVRSSFDPNQVLEFNLLISDELEKLSLNKSYFRDSIKSRAKQITHVFVDEIQELPWLLNEVHYILENFQYPPCFILTGSSARKLKRGNANLLGGRAWNLNLHPLVYLELKGKFNLTKALEYGTLPAIYFDHSIENILQKLSAYVETYLNEEIRKEALTRDLFTFVNFLRLAAENNGGIVNYSNIASDVGLRSQAIADYYQILEDTLLGSFLRPLGRSYRSQVTKHPKFYFFDYGVVRAITKRLKSPLAPATDDYGDAFEHFLINDLLHTARYLNSDLEFSFYRNSSGAEVDLIVELPNGEMFAIEIKSKPNPSPKDYSGLKSLARLNPKARLICACTTSKKYERADVLICPWQDLYEMLGLG